MLSYSDLKEFRNELFYAFAPIKHAFLQVWFEYYAFMKNNRILHNPFNLSMLILKRTVLWK